MKYKLHNCRGTGLLETIVALGVIVSGLIAVFTLVLGNARTSRENTHRLLATNLAREGLEVVRNVRDSNGLVDPPPGAWAGIPTGTREAPVKVVAVWNPTESGSVRWQLESLGPTDSPMMYTIQNADAAAQPYATYVQGRYWATASTPKQETPYERIIEISEILCAASIDDLAKPGAISCASMGVTGNPVRIGIQMTSTVWWQNRSGNVSLMDTLYDWK